MIGDKEVVYVSIEDIIPNRFQPRLAFDESKLNELANSIKQYGIIQPLILRRVANKYEIIAGERRYKASCIAGLNNVPAIVVDVSDDTSAEIAITENIQRKDLSAIEEAQSYRKLMNKGQTQEEIAKKIGIAQPTIANKLRLLSLPEEIQESLMNDKISERHARSLLRLTDANEQIMLLNKITNEKLTVKQADDEITKLLNNGANFEPQEIPAIQPAQPKLETFTDDTPLFDEILEIPEKEETKLPETEKFETPIFTPFSEFKFEEKEEQDPLVEVFESPKMEEKELEAESEEEPFGELSLADAIREIRDFTGYMEDRGYILSAEEFNLDDAYQVVIKIEKKFIKDEN